MLVREIKRVLLVFTPLFALFLITATLWRTPSDQYSSLRNKVSQVAGDLIQWTPSNSAPDSLISETHQGISSLSTPDGRFFPIKFGDITAFNPSIIPHPQLGGDAFLLVAQKRRVNPGGSEPEDTSVFNVEIGCTASFITSPATGSVSLECIDHPETLPIAATPGSKCSGKLAYIAWNIGPHDARVFWGPKKPLVIFGSNSEHACFGMFLQDFRVLVDWKPVTFGEESWRLAKELERPPPWGVIEKNWFVWWDKEGAMYAHYEMFPRRGFARVDGNGAAGGDLGGLVGRYTEEEEGTGAGTGVEGRGRGREKEKDWNRDTECMERYFPRLPRNGPEDIHQATNSLRVTLCNRRGNRTASRQGNKTAI